ncbi:Uncharacterised protein [Achromobacter xylosoxidans]|nr:Uncharacterised protein [Achromobacter xylosoxidans]
MAAAEHQGAGTVEPRQLRRQRRARQVGPQRQRHQQQDEQGQTDVAAEARRALGPVGQEGPRRHLQQGGAGDGTQRDGADLPQRRRQRQRHQRGHHRQPGARTIGAERSAHAPYGLGDDGHRRHFQAVHRRQARQAAKPRQPQAQQDHRQRRRQRERQPGGQHARPPRPLQAQGHADLAAGRPRQELAKRHQIGKSVIVEPAAAVDEFLAEIGQMRHRTAKGRQAQAQESQEDLHTGAPSGRDGFAGRRLAGDVFIMKRRLRRHRGGTLTRLKPPGMAGLHDSSL